MALVFYPRSFLSILVSLFLYYVKIDRTNKQHIIDKIKKELYIYIYMEENFRFRFERICFMISYLKLFLGNNTYIWFGRVTLRFICI